MVKPFITQHINGFACRTDEQVQDALNHGKGPATVSETRIEQALQVLKAAQRFGTINAWDGEILSARPVTDGEWTRSDVLDDAIKILEG